MASKTFHFTTTASTAPVPVPDAGNMAAITGYEMTNTAATAMWVKFYWGNATNFSSGKDVPTVGTDTPGLTVALGAGTATVPVRAANSWTQDAAVRGKVGALFMAVTGGQPDSDNTAPAAGAVITVTYL